MGAAVFCGVVFDLCYSCYKPLCCLNSRGKTKFWDCFIFFFSFNFENQTRTPTPWIASLTSFFRQQAPKRSQMHFELIWWGRLQRDANVNMITKWGAPLYFESFFRRLLSANGRRSNEDNVNLLWRRLVQCEFCTSIAMAWEWSQISTRASKQIRARVIFRCLLGENRNREFKYT